MATKRASSGKNESQPKKKKVFKYVVVYTCINFLQGLII